MKPRRLSAGFNATTCALLGLGFGGYELNQLRQAQALSGRGAAVEATALHWYQGGQLQYRFVVGDCSFGGATPWFTGASIYMGKDGRAEVVSTGKVDVLYLPDNPEISMPKREVAKTLDQGYRPLLGAVMFLAIALFFLVVGRGLQRAANKSNGGMGSA